MKYVIRFIFLLFMISTTAMHAAADLPVFYRTPFFQGEVKEKTRAWSTALEVRYGQGQTSDSWNAYGNKKPLLSMYGPLNITKLGIGVAGAQTEASWAGAGNFIDTNFLPAVASSNDGKINLLGHITTNDATIQLRQQVIYGFFAQLLVPIRQVKIDRITYENLGAADVHGQNVVTFFTNTLNPVLTEHGIKNWDQAFNKTALSDIDLTVGWKGYMAVGSSLIADISGTLQGGLVIPCTEQRDPTCIASIPLGYHKDLGFVARGSGEVAALDWLAAGVYGSATIFLPVTQNNVPLKNHTAQSGWFFLKKGRVRIEPGTVWNVGGYLRCGGLSQGLSFILGLSYTKQEQTDLSIADSTFTVYVKEGATYTERLATATGDTNDVINSDPRWRGWGSCELHAALRFALGDSKARFAPSCQLEYNYPIEGKLVFKNPSYAGSLGLRMNFGF